ncbi:hypothetical protein GJ496_008499 [Pomphorhynchus laevis]|nr:hypothetical protein GJ496_008499 [Pomphorhynchus laevis]
MRYVYIIGINILLLYCTLAKIIGIASIDKPSFTIKQFKDDQYLYPSIKDSILTFDSSQNYHIYLNAQLQDKFIVDLRFMPLTRRGIIWTISGHYDNLNHFTILLEHLNGHLQLHLVNGSVNNLPNAMKMILTLSLEYDQSDNYYSLHNMKHWHRVVMELSQEFIMLTSNNQTTVGDSFIEYYQNAHLKYITLGSAGGFSNKGAESNVVHKNFIGYMTRLKLGSYFEDINVSVNICNKDNATYINCSSVTKFGMNPIFAYPLELSLPNQFMILTVAPLANAITFSTVFHIAMLFKPSLSHTKLLTISCTKTEFIAIILTENKVFVTFVHRQINSKISSMSVECEMLMNNWHQFSLFLQSGGLAVMKIDNAKVSQFIGGEWTNPRMFNDALLYIGGLPDRLKLEIDMYLPYTTSSFIGSIATILLNGNLVNVAEEYFSISSSVDLKTEANLNAGLPQCLDFMCINDSDCIENTSALLTVTCNCSKTIFDGHRCEYVSSLFQYPDSVAVASLSLRLSDTHNIFDNEPTLVLLFGLIIGNGTHKLIALVDDEYQCVSLSTINGRLHIEIIITKTRANLTADFHFNTGIMYIVEVSIFKKFLTCRINEHSFSLRLTELLNMNWKNILLTLGAPFENNSTAFNFSKARLANQYSRHRIDYFENIENAVNIVGTQDKWCTDSKTHCSLMELHCDIISIEDILIADKQWFDRQYRREMTKMHVLILCLIIFAAFVLASLAIFLLTKLLSVNCKRPQSKASKLQKIMDEKRLGAANENCINKLYATNAENRKIDDGRNALTIKDSQSICSLNCHHVFKTTNDDSLMSSKLTSLPTNYGSMGVNESYFKANSTMKSPNYIATNKQVLIQIGNDTSLHSNHQTYCALYSCKPTFDYQSIQKCNEFNI